MSRVVCVLIALAFTGGLFAQEPTPQPKIVGELKVKPHTLVRLKADGVCVNASVLWDVWPFDAKADVATTGPGVFEFVAPPGTYTVQMTAYSVGDKGQPIVSRARATVVVGEDKPVPPPTPPTPPVPPVPPVPTDPLAKDLAALYVADTSPTKAAHLELLVELYRQVADLATKPDTTSLAELLQRAVKAAAAEIPAGKLEAVRRRITVFLASEFGEEDGPMTPELRVKAAATCNRVRDALKAIGGGQ